jgi:hypothetical protein
MIVGDPSIFAVESEITRAYERLSLRALGFFVIHVMGRCHGFKEPDSTMLASAFDGVNRRIVGRGSHRPTFAIDEDAREIALAYRRSYYAECEDGELFFGMTDSQFSHSMHENDLVWAPDGEEGFDDGSYVFQFEDESRVRLIAFHSTAGFLIDPDSLRDVWIPIDYFYGILQNWVDSFMNEWKSLPKVSDASS